MLAFLHSGADFIFLVLLALPALLIPVGIYLVLPGRSFAARWIGCTLMLTAVAIIVWWNVYV